MSSQVFCEHVSVTGHAYGHLHSLGYAGVFQSSYSWKHVFFYPLSSQAFWSISYSDCYPLPLATVANKFTLMLPRMLPQPWEGFVAGKISLSPLAHLLGSHQTDQNTEPEFFENKSFMTSSDTCILQ